MLNQRIKLTSSFVQKFKYQLIKLEHVQDKMTCCLNLNDSTFEIKYGRNFFIYQSYRTFRLELYFLLFLCCVLYTYSYICHH